MVIGYDIQVVYIKQLTQEKQTNNYSMLAFFCSKTYLAKMGVTSTKDL
jgi:hypothetical protein